ncbi:MAG: transglycosylase domain-containing protein, partial [Chloroflexota bacterium]|nr:transglycosylase domain-containing protein [Chloroflexota bacterium]
MSNNFWDQPPYNGNQPPYNGNQPPYNGNQPPYNGNQSPDQNAVPRSGNLLREYRHQQDAQQRSPAPGPAWQPPPQSGPPRSPMPPAQSQPSQRQGGLLSRGIPPNQGWIANTMQTVRRWSGRTAAVHPQAAQQPMVLQRPQAQTRAPETAFPKRKPWKRSRAVRTSRLMKRRRGRWGRQGFSKRKVVLGVTISLFLLIVVLLSSGGASAYAYYQAQLPKLQGLATQHVVQTSRIYDRNGNLLNQAYDLNAGGRRTPVAYKYIPKVMQDAMIAAEDPSFWNNTGVDPSAILRAASTQVGGASTLTQQLIKNLTHNTQYSLDRKVSEAALAIGLTQQYPKWKILEMYFNVAPYGALELGVEAAVEDYFGLSPQCDKSYNCIPAIYNLDYDAVTGKHDPVLGLARASLLAGMPQNPVEYDPTIDHGANKDRALGRQLYVLSQMLKNNMQVDGLGPITPDIINQVAAMTAKMTFPGYHVTLKSPHFVYWVIGQLEAALGDGNFQAGQEAFLTGGYNVRTTIDSDLETYVEKATQRHLYKPEYQLYTGYSTLSKDYNVNDSAVVVMDAKTGEVLAMNGSANWGSTSPKVKGQVNAALAPRQPGSSFKPIVYATAFQMGWYPGIVLPDVKTYFPIGNNVPQNDPEHQTYHTTDYGGGYNKTRLPIRDNLADSYNVPAVKAIEFTGYQNVLNMARRMGISAIDDFLAACRKKHPGDTDLQCGIGPAMALGSIEVPLLQMVGAYQVFANKGYRIPPKGVLDIWDNYGNHLYHFDPAHPEGGGQVLSPQISYLMTSILSDEPARAREFGPIHTLSMLDWQNSDGQQHAVAAKTGTTDNFKDNWTVGYTPDVVVGAWSGNANGAVFYKGVIGITGAAPIWHSVIERAMGGCNKDGAGIPCGNYHSPYHDHAFIKPAGVRNVCTSSATGLLGSGNWDFMLDDEVPQQ